MRAFTLDSSGAQPALREDIPEPHAGDSEMLVRVHASSVNPVDVFIAAGGLKEMAEHEFPVILGRDFAGVVEQLGSGVSRYRAGDEVFGFVLHADPAVHDGSWAELITVPESNEAAPKAAPARQRSRRGRAARRTRGSRRRRRTRPRQGGDRPRCRSLRRSRQLLRPARCGRRRERYCSCV